MAFKLFKNDDEHFDDAVDLIKRKEYEKAMNALRKAKSKDKDGSMAAKCDAMEAFINLYNKQGAEGEESHNENGINRKFESSWISAQLLREVTPYAGAIK